MDKLMEKYCDAALDAVKEIFEKEFTENTQSMDIELSITPFNVTANTTRRTIPVSKFVDVKGENECSD